MVPASSSSSTTLQISSITGWLRLTLDGLDDGVDVDDADLRAVARLRLAEQDGCLHREHGVVPGAHRVPRCSR